MADDGDSGAGGSGGPFCFSKKESSEVIVRSVVLVFGDLVACELAHLKRTGASLPVKSNENMNIAEGPSTIATLSNQFIVKCSVRSHHVYKCIIMESLHW